MVSFEIVFFVACLQQVQTLFLVRKSNIPKLGHTTLQISKIFSRILIHALLVIPCYPHMLSHVVWTRLICTTWQTVVQPIVGQISTEHLTTISVYRAKVTIKKVILSNYFGQNLWCTFTQILNEKKCKFLIFKVTKSWVTSKYTA